MSCSPKSVFKNLIDLCRPKSKALSGFPFTPKFGVAVDMFPHTAHMELVLVLERDTNEKSVKEDEAKVLEKDSEVVAENTTEEEQKIAE